MKKRLDKIRAAAIETREKLSYANADDRKAIAKLDRVILGAVLVKWIHLFAAVSFAVLAAVFMYLVYPDAKFMLLMLSFAAVGYAVSWLGIVIQMKLYDHTIDKVRAALEAEPDILVEA
jgi:VIT1/CCC1 family predicted Fe2+/Mn2+ transporter